MLKRTFHFVLILFCGLVPLVDKKEKLASIPLSADFVLGSLLILLGILVLLQTKNKKATVKELFRLPVMKSMNILVLVFLGMSVVSIVYSMNKTAAISETIRAIEYAMIFYMILMISEAVTIKRSLKTFYVSMILASIYGVIQFVLNNNTEFAVGGLLHRAKVSSTFVNPNYWGAAINLVIFYPILNILKKKNTKINISIFLLFFFNLIFSSTRGSWLGFVLGLCVIGVVRYKKFIYYVTAIIVGMALLPMTRDRFLQADTITSRLKLWKTGLYMFKDHFWTGVGNGNYLYNYETYVRKLHPELWMYKTKYSVHNSYIKMFAELGIFGGLTFILMYLNLFGIVVYVYKVSEKYKNCALAFLCFGAAYLLQNMANNLIFIPQLNVLVWVCAALLLKATLLEKEVVDPADAK